MQSMEEEPKARRPGRAEGGRLERRRKTRREDLMVEVKENQLPYTISIQ